MQWWDLSILKIAFILVDKKDQVAKDLGRHDVCPEARRNEQLLNLLMDHATNIYELLNFEIDAPILNNFIRSSSSIELPPV